jgi:hypothetical protein
MIYCNVILYFISSWCNDWPEIIINCNGVDLFFGKIEKSANICLEFPIQDNNIISVKYINKRNGPDIWDTNVKNGKIIEDQHCILTGLNINKSKSDWVLEELIYYRNNGTVNNQCRGFMDLPGCFEIEFPQDVYKWIANGRRKKLTQTSHQSSIAYENIYIPDNNYNNIQQLLKDIQELIDKI